MKRALLGRLHPEGFHGRGAGSPFFEGWYLKLATADETRAVALIPGIFRGRQPASHHAFVQVVDEGVRYHRFSAGQLDGAEDRFDVRIGPNRFHEHGLSVDLDRCRGDLRFGPMTPWPVSIPSPGAMGWFAWVPFMQCYHAVPSFGHELYGYLELDGQSIDFTGGRGYLEKDWGRSFPKTWVWMQGQHFNEDFCVAVSLADVPWLGRSFPGLLAAMHFSSPPPELDPFLFLTTYGGARVRGLARTPDGIDLRVGGGGFELELNARGGAPVSIHIPSEDSMDQVVEERLGATLSVRLSRRGRTVLETRGQLAAYEAHGDIDRLGGKS